MRNRHPSCTIRRQSPSPAFALRPIACCVILACSEAAWANPTAPSVAAGAASFQNVGKTLSVTNAPGTIINWQGFSIGAGESTRFLQQSAASAVLNRVVGSDASSLLGSLTSNGRVFLVNPNGIVFGAGARIDTAGFIASTLNITDKDFLQGKLRFEGGGNGVLRNAGAIRASGDIMLVGPQIENAGIIQSDHGSVLLAAGRSVTITSPDAQGVRFELQAPTDSALNIGTIAAASSAAMFAGTLHHSGDIRATGASVSESGKVSLIAQKDAIVDKGAVVTASGLNGGSVKIQSGDLTMVSGRVEAIGSAGPGGTVQILGNRVGLDAGASVDASGETGGGAILVGGDYQGKNPDVQNAWRTFVAPDATLRADAVTSGDGGKVIVWADDTTRFYGSISARGGVQSGDGGFVETSGKEHLSVIGAHVDTGAPAGRTGNWLLDPHSIIVLNSINSTTRNDVDDFSDTPTGDVLIDPGTINSAASNVRLQANTDITFSSPIAMSGAGLGLTAQAGRSINVNADIATTNGTISLTANETTANGVIPLLRDLGAAALMMAPGTQINAGNADVFLRVSNGGGHDSTSGDIVVANVTGANVSIFHDGPTANGKILRAPPVAGVEPLITAGTSLLLALENPAGSAGSIGVEEAPMRIATPALEAYTRNSAGGIFINSPGAGALQIGGVPNTIYSGDIRGVQTRAGGGITITAGGALTRFQGSLATCGAGGGTGGPICAVGGDIALTAASIGAAGAGGRMYVAANNVSATTAAGGIFLRERGGDALLNHYAFSPAANQAVELSNIDADIVVNTDVSLPGSPFSLVTGGGHEIRFVGPVTVGASSLALSGAGTATFASGTVNLNPSVSALLPISVSGGTVNFNGPLAAFSDISISSGAANFNASSAVAGGVALSGGTLGGTGTVDIAGTMTWTAGTMTGIGITNANGSATMSGGATKNLFGGRTLNITEGATVTWAGAGSIQLGGGATIANAGIWADQSTNASIIDAGGGGTFTNNGTYTKSIDAGTTTIGTGVAFNNNTAGAVNVNSGTLRVSGGGTSTGNLTVAANTTLDLNAGTYNINAGSVSGAGTVLFSGGTTNINAGAYSVTGATTVSAGAATFAAASTVNSVGALTVSGGTLTLNSGETIAAPAMSISGGTLGGSDNVNVVGNTVWSGGTMTGPGVTTANGGMTISGAGPKNLTGGRALNVAAGTTATWLGTGGIQAGGGAAIANAGTWADQSTNASITDSGGGGIFANTGTYAKSIDAGTTTVGTGVVFNNTLGTVNVNTGTLRLRGGGTSTGNLAVAAGTALDLNAGTYDISTGNVSGAGTVLFSGAASNLNGGIYNVTGATGVTGGVANFAATASVTSVGAVSVSGTGVLSLDSGETIAPTTLTLSGGTLSGADTVNVAGATTWTGGAMIGTGITNANGGTTIGGAGTKSLSGGRTLNVAAVTTATWTGAGGIQAGGGATIGNAGTWADQSTSASITDAGGGATFTNIGTYAKSNDPGTSTIGTGVTFTNIGTVNVTSGKLSLDNFQTNAGTIGIGSGAVLATGGAPLVNAGTIGGSGTLELGAATLTNNGTLRPGDSVGTLFIGGNLVQGATGAVDVQLAGTAPDQADVVAVSGAASLGGTLSVTHIDGFNPPSDSIYTVMTYASRTGDFTAKTFPAGYGTFYSATPNASRYTLGLGAVVNEWTGVPGSTDFLWQNPANWTLAHAPTSGEDALINNVGGPGVTDTITVSSGSQNARKVTSFENLGVSGGALTLGPLASVVDAGLTVSGGQLTANGSLSANSIVLSGGVLDAAVGTLPRLDMTGGVLTRSAPGDLTISGPFNLSGGFIASSTGAARLVTLGNTVVTNAATTSRNWSNAGALDLQGEIVLSGASFANAAGGRLTIDQAGRMDLAGTTLDNAGALVLSASAANTTPLGNQPAGGIVNTGSIDKRLAGTVQLVQPLTNGAGGTVNVKGGTLSVAFGGTQSGTIEIDSGAQLNTDGSLTNAAGGVIGGRGTLELFGATLTNDGTLRPGSRGPMTLPRTGTLTVRGDVINAGSVEVRLGGQADGQFDALAVTGTANLGGALNLSTTPAYTATDGDTYSILSAAAISGNFGSITKTFANGVNVLQRPNLYLIGLGGPTVNSWIFDTSGNWTDSDRWSLGHAPLANEQVFINRPTNLSVTVPAGSFEADALRSTENIFLAGSLGLASPSSIAAVLSITSGGVLQGAGPVLVSDLSLNGTIASTGGVTVTGITGPIGNGQVTGKLTVNGFQMVSGGSIDIGTTGELNFTGGAEKRMGDGTLNIPVLNNSGLVTLSGSNLKLGGGNVNIFSGGRFDIRGDVGIESAGGPLPNITNAGTFAKTGGIGTSTIGSGPLAFVNTGVLDAQTGTLQFAGTNTFNAGTSFTGAGSNVVTNDSTLNGAITSSNLTLQSGNFGGDGNLEGTTRWTGGAVVGALTVPNAATLTLEGAETKTVNGATASLTNNGTLTIGGDGALVLTNGASLTNNAVATWNGGARSIAIGTGSTLTNGTAASFNLSAGVTDTGVTGAGTFQNNGRLNSTAAGITTLLAAPLDNAGTLNVDGGTLRLTANGTHTGVDAIDAGTTLELGGGTHNLGAGSSVTGAGTLAVTGGALNVSGAYGTATTAISGGTASFSGAAAHTTGTLNLSGAATTLTIAGGATLALTGANSNVVDAGTLANAGTLNLTGTGNLILNAGAVVNNTGTLDLQSNVDIGRTAAAGAIPALVNSGKIRKSGGSGTSTIGGALALASTSNGGTFEVTAGNTLTHAGTNTFNTGTTFIGTGANRVTSDSTFNGTITSADLTLAAGNFAGDASFAGTTAWSGGNMTGAVTIPGGATLNVAGGGATTASTAASFTNNGTVNFAGSQTIAAPFSNAGTVNIDGGTLSLAGSGTDTGTYAIDAGTSLDLTGGTRNFNAGIALTGLGRMRTFATLNLNTGFTQASAAPAWSLNGGTLNGASDLTLNGVFSVAGGVITGAGLLTTGAPSTTNVSGAVTLAGKRWDNLGAVSLSDQGQIVLGSAPGVPTTLNNLAGGTIIDTSLSTTPLTTGTTTRVNKSVVNAGTFQKNASSADTQTLDVPFVNSGKISVNAGTLQVNGLPVNSGTIELAAGTTLSTLGASLSNDATGRLKGNGTLDLGGGTFTNGGGLAPGASPGTLTIAGNFTQLPGGTLEIDLGGTRQGIDYDLLRITGTANLGGTLAINVSPGAAIGPGSTYDFMTYPNHTGDFASTTVPPGSAFQGTPGPSGYRATAAGTPVPETAPDEVSAVTTRDALLFSDRFLTPPVQLEQSSGPTRDELPECR